MLAQPGLTPISWAGSIDAIFLRSLLRARIFVQGYTDVNDLTDDVIKNRLCYFVEGSKPVSFDDALADVKRNVRLDFSEPDARLRILMLQTSYLDLCERRGWNFVENAPKAAIKNIFAVLQPPALTSRIKNAPRLERSVCPLSRTRLQARERNPSSRIS